VTASLIDRKNYQADNSSDDKQEDQSADIRVNPSAQECDLHRKLAVLTVFPKFEHRLVASP
jgi:hypothetical protein